MTLANRRDSVGRKIYFFRADIGVDDGGIPLQFDPLPALKIINSLTFSDDGDSRYQFDIDGNALCIVEPLRRQGRDMRFCLVRRTGLPQLERRGNITDLNIDQDMGLLEAIHIVFFPVGASGATIVGTEYNHFGPRISRLGSYLYEKSEGTVERPVLKPLLRRDFAEQLNRLGEIRLFEMSISPSFAGVVRDADRSLGEAFDANARVVGSPETISLIARPENRHRRSFLERLSGPLRFILNHEQRQQIDKLQIKGKCADTGLVETIDFLKDQFISTKRIFRLNRRSRALDPNSAFQAIREAYNDFREELESAASVSFDASM